MNTRISLGILALTIPLWLSGACADDKTWEGFFEKVALPMELALISRENFFSFEWDVAHQLVGLSCNNRGDISLVYDFEDGWKRELKIPGDHRFARYDLVEESGHDQVATVRNTLGAAFRVRAVKATGPQIEKSEKISVLGAVVRTEGGGTKLLFTASDPDRNELLAQAYTIAISWDLLEEMRAACPGSVGTAFEEADAK